MKLKSLTHAFKIAVGVVASTLFMPKEAEAQYTPQKQASYGIATYLNVHEQRGRIGAGIFTGPVQMFRTGETHFEFNAYASCRITGEQSPVSISNGVLLGSAFNNETANKIYASVNARICPNFKKEGINFLNNAYLISSFPVKSNGPVLNKPMILFGFKIPLTNSDGDQTPFSIWGEGRRVPPAL